MYKLRRCAGRLLWLIGLPFLGANADAQTLERIRSAGTINIGFVLDQAPFSSASKEQEPDGYAIDLCKLVVSAMKANAGVPSLGVSFVPTSAAAGMEMVESGRLDLLCGAVGATLKARERVSFSIPIYVTGIGALVRRDAPASLLRVLDGQVAYTGPTWRATVNSGLSNHTYAVHAGTADESWIRERIASLRVIAKVVTVPGDEEGIRMVESGKASAYFADRVSLVHLLANRSDGDDLMVVDRRFTLEPVALALRRGDEDFRLAVDTALSQLYRSGQYVPAYEHYFGEPTDAARLLFQAYALR
jgi:polar amino acid transport system substrate-binding protein